GRLSDGRRSRPPHRWTGLDAVLGSRPPPRAALPALHGLRRVALSSRTDVSALPVVRQRVGAGERAGAPALVGGLPPAGAAGLEGAHALRRGAGRVRGGRPHHGEPARRRPGGAAHGHAHGRRLRAVARRCPRAAGAAGRLSRWALLLAAALAMIVRAPVYLTA